MNKYQLHSSGENWFHFRKDLDSMMESFSVTHCHDGTVCMTGDYGCLSWHREGFSGKADYGFPNKLSGIGYFAQKVVRAEEDQHIKTWKQDKAKQDILKTIEDDDAPWDIQQISFLRGILEDIDGYESDGEYGYIQMLEAFNKSSLIDSETFCEFGRCYTDSFKWKYDILTSVSDQILRAISKKCMMCSSTVGVKRYPIKRTGLVLNPGDGFVECCEKHAIEMGLYTTPGFSLRGVK